MKRISAREALGRLQAGAVVVDVREIAEFERAHIEGTVNVPLATFTAEIAADLHQKNPALPLVVTCLGGVRSAKACSVLPPSFNVEMLDGGLQAWRAEELPVVEAKSNGWLRGLLGA